MLKLKREHFAVGECLVQKTEYKVQVVQAKDGKGVVMATDGHVMCVRTFKPEPGDEIKLPIADMKQVLKMAAPETEVQVKGEGLAIRMKGDVGALLPANSPTQGMPGTWTIEDLFRIEHLAHVVLDARLLIPVLESMVIGAGKNEPVPVQITLDARFHDPENPESAPVLKVRLDRLAEMGEEEEVTAVIMAYGEVARQPRFGSITPVPVKQEVE